MSEFSDVIDFYTRIINALKSGKINPHLSLEEIALKAGKDSFAYIDNRRDAKGKFSYDLWKFIKNQFDDESLFKNWVKSKGITEKLLYSKSEQFPDFIFKVKKLDGELICGSLLELKDSKGGSVASFNSTLPTKYKTLKEIDIINGKNLVSRVASIIDKKLSLERFYYTFERKCFYLVRTHAGKDDKVKISVVDGSFFETIPKDHLIYQMFLNVLRTHMEKKEIKIPHKTLKQIENSLSRITDQTIIASSQNIDGASVRPRLRIMAEVHSEGNPHSSFYPEISERSFNFIIKASDCRKEIVEQISRRIYKIKTFTINHKRNGEHMVFQYGF